MKTDVQVEDLDDEGNASNPKRATSIVDYESKYRGASKKIDAYSRQLAELEAKLDEANGKVAEFESKVRLASVDKETATKTLTAQIEAANLEKANLLKKLSSFEARDLTRQKLASKEEWKPLTELVDKGHLKLASEFEKPEDFDAYVNDMLGWRGAVAPAAPAKPSSAGAVPPVGASTRVAKEVLTEDQIFREIDRLDATIPDQSKRLVELYDLLGTLGTN